MAAKLCRAAGCSDGRLALVGGGAELRVCARCLEVLHLSGNGRDVPLAVSRFFFCVGTRLDAAVASVITDTVDDGGVANDGGVVGVVNVRDVDVIDGAVVEEVSAV